jgi:hypothetical protein
MNSSKAVQDEYTEQKKHERRLGRREDHKRGLTEESEEQLPTEFGMSRRQKVALNLRAKNASYR